MKAIDDLIPVEDKDKTPLRNLTPWVIYRLMREGKLPHVKVGRRRYLTTDGIAAFIAAGGEIQQRPAPVRDVSPPAPAVTMPWDGRIKVPTWDWD